MCERGGGREKRDTEREREVSARHWAEVSSCSEKPLRSEIVKGFRRTAATTRSVATHSQQDSRELKDVLQLSAELKIDLFHISTDLNRICVDFYPSGP